MDGEIASLSSEVAVSADLAAAPADIAETPAGPFRIARSRDTAAAATNSASMESIRGCRAASTKKWQKRSEDAAQSAARRPIVAATHANTIAQVSAAGTSDGNLSASSFHPSQRTQSSAVHHYGGRTWTMGPGPQCRR